MSSYTGVCVGGGMLGGVECWLQYFGIRSVKVCSTSKCKKIFQQEESARIRSFYRGSQILAMEASLTQVFLVKKFDQHLITSFYEQTPRVA